MKIWRYLYFYGFKKNQLTINLLQINCMIIIKHNTYFYYLNLFLRSVTLELWVACNKNTIIFWFKKQEEFKDMVILTKQG